MGLWPFNKNTPKNSDGAIQDLARMFLSCPEKPTPGSELLDVTHLDFSVNSLAVVDQHLERMRSQKLEGKSLLQFTVRFGAYVGEVIRRQSPKKTWHWLDHDEAAKICKLVASSEKSLATSAVLWDSKAEFCFPFAKVLKYLENGAEDSVKWFAEVAISKSNEAR